jgi:hypothetical protein
MAPQHSSEAKSYFKLEIANDKLSNILVPE